jgi:phosphate-selective porin OprO/OprP
MTRSRAFMRAPSLLSIVPVLLLITTRAHAQPSASPPTLDDQTLSALIDKRITQLSTAGYDATNSFYVRSADGKARLRLGGYTQFDGRLFTSETVPSQVDQFQFRAIRPELVGTIFEHYDFRLLPDFANSKLVIQDAYVDLHFSDKLEVRFGKSKVAFGLERLQPDVATTFVERGLPSLLTPNRDLGVQVFGTLGIVTYQLSLLDGIADNASSDFDTSDHKELAARVVVTEGPVTAGGAVMVGTELGTFAQTDLGSWVTQGGTTMFAYTLGTSAATTPDADGRHIRATAHADYYCGAIGALAEYVVSQQHVGLGVTDAVVTAEAWQALAQYVIGGTPGYRGIVPTGKYGAFDIAARFGEIRLLDDAAFTAGLADPTKSVRKAFSGGLGVDYVPNRGLRFVLDTEVTAFRGGAMTGDRATETSLVGRVQTVF